MDKNTWNGKCPTWQQFINEGLVNEHSTARGYAAAKKAADEYDENSMIKHYPNMAEELRRGNVVYTDNDAYTIYGTVQEKKDGVTLLYTIIDDSGSVKNEYKMSINFVENSFQNPFVVLSQKNLQTNNMPICLAENEEMFNALKDDINSSLQQKVIKNWKDLSRAIKKGELDMDKDYDKPKDDNKDEIYV